MKKSIVLSLLLMMVFGSVMKAEGTKKEKFKVYGNCGMCEKRIETAAKSVEGVSAADWNKDTKMMEVSYDSTKVNVNQIHLAIAKAGHDTELDKASEEAYNSLPSCCQYLRKEDK